MTRLRVALDARSLQECPLGGVGRSTRGVISAVENDVEFHLLVDGRRPPVDLDLPQRALRSSVSATKAAWLQLAVPRALRGFGGIFHSPWYGLPFRQPVPMVVTIYDLTFEHGSVGFRPHQRLAYRVQARWAARTAAHILTGSSPVRDELAARYGVDRGRVSVQPSLLDRSTTSTDEGKVRAFRERFGLHGRYVVAVGGARRRRVDLVLAAWPLIQARAPGTMLLIVGAAPSELPAGAVAAGPVDDTDWAAAFAGADALVYPTEYEGFGYPALEAMALGTPVVYAPVGALPEVVGDAGVQIDRHDPAAVAAAVLSVLDDAELARRLVVAGLERVDESESADALRDCVLAAYTRAATARV